MKKYKLIAEKQAEIISILVNAWDLNIYPDVRKKLDKLSLLESQEVEGVSARDFICKDNKFIDSGKVPKWNDLEKQNLAYDLYGVERLMEQYTQQSSKVTDEDIEKYIEEKYPVIMHEGEDINGYFKECLTEDLKALRDGVIKKSN
jgi:hypothetical protein